MDFDPETTQGKIEMKKKKTHTRLCVYVIEVTPKFSSPINFSQGNGNAINYSHIARTFHYNSKVCHPRTAGDNLHSLARLHGHQPQTRGLLSGRHDNDTVKRMRKQDKKAPPWKV